MTTASLSENDRCEIVVYRIEKALQTYSEAVAGVESGFVGTAANRLYYAAYYAVTALLISNGIAVRTHDGVRRMLGLHYLKNGLLDKQLGQTFNMLFSLRITGDYQDRKNLDIDSDVRPLVVPTKTLIDKTINMARENIRREAGKGV